MQFCWLILHNTLCKIWRVSDSKYEHQRTNSTFGTNDFELFLGQTFDIMGNWKFKIFNFPCILWEKGGIYQKTIEPYFCALFHDLLCKISNLNHKLFNSVLFAHRQHIVFSSNGFWETLSGHARQIDGQTHRRTCLNQFFSSIWSIICILYRVSDVCFYL